MIIIIRNFYSVLLTLLVLISQTMMPLKAAGFERRLQEKNNVLINRYENNLGSTNVKLLKPNQNLKSELENINKLDSKLPTVVFLDAGIYDLTGFDVALPENIHVRGSGTNVTFIETANGNNIIAASNSSISDLTIRYRGSGEGAITDGKSVQNFTLERIAFEIHDNNAAIFFDSGGNSTVWLYDVKIVTEGVGIYAATSGHYYLHDVDIFLTGNGIGNPHIGIQIDSGSRFYIWGSKIGTGYGYPIVTNDNDQDIIAIYIPSHNMEIPRIEIHGLESFCKNENALPNVNVNVIRAEAGWVRCFGCFGQSETPPYWGIGRTLYQSGNGIIEVFGSRFSSYTGNIYGSPQRGVSLYDTTSNGYHLEKFEGGLLLLDASVGSFTLYLDSTPTKGQEYIFKKIDESENIVTISGNGNLIDGKDYKELAKQYDVLKIIGGFGSWHTY